MNNNFKAILFDLDGTLIDTAPIIGTILNSIRTEKDLKPLSNNNYREWISLGANRLIRNAMNDVDFDITTLLLEFRKRYNETKIPIESLFIGTHTVLERLFNSGLKLAICSNKPEALCKKTLFDTGLSKYFSLIVGGDTISKQKPNPEPIEFILETLGIGSGSALFVGDSTVDQKAALAANIPFIFFSKGYDDGVDRKNTFLNLDNLNQLVDFIFLEPNI